MTPNVLEQQMEVEGEDSNLQLMAFDDSDDDIILGDASQDHQQRNTKRRAALDSEITETSIVPTGVRDSSVTNNSGVATGEQDSSGLTTFWETAIKLYRRGSAQPPEEVVEEEIDSLSTVEQGTEEVDFMDSERSKEARLAEDQGERNTNKKTRAVLQNDEAVWGANGPMGPHYESEFGDDIHDL